MRASTKPRLTSSLRHKPEAAIPKFREVRLSAVAAACALPKKSNAEAPKKNGTIVPGRRFEEG
ncbi:MAG: hypothetical protein JO094_12540 [Hyphomicrobiales bacterium]|nr:hypothetical protein [Hyphomicrobiales bacterium]MBV9751173.1 hypothetical protein [Hyphomicrobiales bacterium]